MKMHSDTVSQKVFEKDSYPKKYFHSGHPPPFCRVEPLIKFSKRGGLTEPQLLKGVAGKAGVTFFRGGGLQFSHKNELKSEIFNGKKSL